jgi:serine/threonine-protein kinase
MTPERWSDARRILEDALELDDTARRGFVRRACADDAQLHAEVESLLGHDGGMLARARPPLPGAASDLALTADVDGAVGSRIGPYRLTGVIATGGMGSVYSALRADDQYEKLVAIKVFRGSLRSAGAVARFHRERQILARLEHPSITRLIDGGTTGDGRPYIVMEHVDGTPLVRHAEARSLDGRQRLELFGGVCASVQFAHQNLVVHRDLKPDNILVTDDGAVKLLDFGISKLLPQDDTGATDPTSVTAAAPMTIRYSSPEQIAGDPVTTATDVYSLGVVLFELLTGRPPYDVGPSLKDATAAIRAAAPPPPSSLVPALDREVDAIVLHALEKEPGRRYQTVEMLADDIRRLLDGLPVLAHPPTRFYLLRKAAWRHRWPVALVTTAVLLVATASIVAGALSIRLAAEKRAALAAQTEEARARERSDRLNDFLAETLISADPRLGGREDLSVLRLLEDASRRLSTDFDGDEQARAALHLTIGRSYLNLWLVRDAAPHLAQAVAMHRRCGDDDGLAEALASMGQVHAFEFDGPAAEASWRECRDIRRAGAADPETSEAVADAETGHAQALATLGRHAEAEAAARAALEIRRRRHGRAHRSIAEATDELAWIVAQAGDGDRSLALHEEAMSVRRALYGRHHEFTADGLEVGARINGAVDRADEARRLWEEALVVRRAVHGDRHPLTIDARLHAGIYASRLGRTERGHALMKEAVEIAQSTLPAWHRTVRYALSVYGLHLSDAARYDEAEPLLLAALDGSIRLWGAGNTLSLHLRIHLERMYRHLGRADDADRMHVADRAARDRYGADDRETCRACGFAFGPMRGH